ncbi:5047_t:CDS:10 [Diversispora eburnea]|uniref:5047_t:CDS:1 n=1 Tax=Diversispora eburnea TaxID=1213867 RepID=A0A9N9BID6_9GLOM|nr:5047_t:CDS:10 [Diversispora eburnea]
MSNSNAGNNIKVVCRFRPQNSREIREGGVPIIDYDENGETCRMEGKEFQGNFTFDRIFPPDTTQKAVFDESIKPIVDEVISGYNGTVFAYGQTGSGKTHTMMGNMDDDEFKGLIPRIVEQIFASIIASPSTIEYTVKVSYMEIYMEKIRDLLNPQNDNLPIHEEKNRGVYVKGLLEVYVSSIQEVYEVMKRGGSARIVAYTNMNAESSRSHSIFVITVNQKNLTDGSVKSGKLSLVDLAGSEKVGKTGASGQTLEEAKKINKSLSALGMVINALTDGKSTHIPYRDSKLTRILQESLGGNSRTTLIINSSPSSFNEAETLSTLRFGMSPAELKALLKKAKSEAVSFQQYISALEGEVGVWRSGGNVPKEKWASMEKGSSSTAPPTPTTPTNPAIEAAKKELDSRPSTPAPILEKDEREEFLRRENELTDQIAEKESILANQEKVLSEMKEELDSYKVHEESITRVQLEKITYDNKESDITMDSLREANAELTNELDALKRSLTDLRAAQKEGDKEQKKQEKMAQILAELDPTGVISAKEKQIRDTVLKLESIDSAQENVTINIEELISVRHELAESKALVSTHEQTINELHQENEHLTRKRDELEYRLNSLELEYEELLDKTIAEEEANNNIDISETIAELRLNFALVDLKRANEELQIAINEKDARSESHKNVAEKEKDMERIRKTMAQQLADFDVMKKALMRDLQNRCEKVVELEISLDETREQYNNVLRNNNNKAQQKKMAFLERNLEQLTNVQKQLVEQNSSLKKEVAIAERKLLARNERIQALEALLQDAQEKLTTQNQKFEAQLQAVRERLEQARSVKSQYQNNSKSIPPQYPLHSKQTSQQFQLQNNSKPTSPQYKLQNQNNQSQIPHNQKEGKKKKEGREGNKGNEGREENKGNEGNEGNDVKKKNSIKKDKHKEFCIKYGIKFSKEDIIHQVCTHKSVISNTAPTNERIDYLAIQLYAAEFLIDRVPSDELHDRVELYTKNSDNLGKIGMRMGLHELLYWTPINAKQVEAANQEGYKLKPSGIESVTGRALQAIVGAIYHDQGDYAAREFVDKHILTAPIIYQSINKNFNFWSKNY